MMNDKNECKYMKKHGFHTMSVLFVDVHLLSGSPLLAAALMPSHTEGAFWFPRECSWNRAGKASTSILCQRNGQLLQTLRRPGDGHELCGRQHCSGHVSTRRPGACSAQSVG